MFADASSSYSVVQYLEPKDEICGTEYFIVYVEIYLRSPKNDVVYVCVDSF